MCSIFGLVSFVPGTFAAEHAERMSNSLRHRGPDASGIFTDNGIFMGNNRLAIVDVAGGEQPMHSADRRYCIVYNGEIFNHRALRSRLEAKGHVFRTNSDTETVLTAFIEMGDECVREFQGMFAFAVWDREQRSLFLARDGLGKKPLYLVEMDNGIAFASEPKALLDLLPQGRRPDWTSISHYFYHGYFPIDETPFEGVRKLPGGHCLTAQETGISSWRYFEPRYGPADGQAPLVDIKELDAMMSRAVEQEMMGEVPVGIFLSGGLDSSLVAHYCVKSATGPVPSFVLKFDEATHDESADAKIVADALGTEHHEIPFGVNDLRDGLRLVGDEMDEPFGDATVIPLRILSGRARDFVKVVLTGWGGDEIFAGYPTMTAHRMASIYRRLPGLLSMKLMPALINRLPVSDKYMSFEFKAKRFLTGTEKVPELQHFDWMRIFELSQVRQIFTPDVSSRITGAPDDVVNNYLKNIIETDVVDRIMHLDSRFFLEGNGLFQADRMTMAASIEARVPLLNEELFAAVSALPARTKMMGGRTKGLMRQLAKPYLPNYIVNKGKKGFGPPVSTWLQGPLAEDFDHILNKEKIRDQGVLSFDTVMALKNEHMSRQKDNGRALWSLLSFQMWYDRFVDS